MSIGDQWSRTSKHFSSKTGLQSVLAGTSWILRDKNFRWEVSRKQKYLKLFSWAEKGFTDCLRCHLASLTLEQLGAWWGVGAASWRWVGSRLLSISSCAGRQSASASFPWVPELQPQQFFLESLGLLPDIPEGTALARHTVLQRWLDLSRGRSAERRFDR